jgi:hypothetical protein
MANEYLSTAARVVLAAVLSVACVKPTESPARPAVAPTKNALRWISRDGFGEGVGWTPHDGKRHVSFVVSDVERARWAARQPQPQALIIEPANLCAFAPELRSAAAQLAIDLADERTPITPAAAECLRALGPSAMSFTLSDPPDGPLSTPVATLLSHLDHCEALGVDRAGDAVAKLLGDRAGSADGVSLRSLVLSHGTLSPDGIAALSKRKELRAVGLPVMTRADGRSAPTGLQALATLPELEWLDLSHGPVTNEDLAALSRIRGLRSLDLAGTEIDDGGAEGLANATELEYLDVGFTNLGDAAAEAIGRLTHLKTLTLAKTRVTDRGMQFLGGLTSLRELRLELTAITDAGLAPIAALRELRHLALPKSVTSEGVARFRATHPLVEIAYLLP